MSAIGHFAAGFAAKPGAPKIPLAVLVIAGETNDILYFLFSKAGIEQSAPFTMDFTQGVRYLGAATNPWSHGLLMSIVWSLADALIALLIFRDRRSAGILGLVVISHWGLDFLMHSNLPLLFDDSRLVGLGLENSGPGMIFMTILDIVLLGGGIAIYLVNRKRARANRLKQENVPA